jgi:hypothetical protein
MACRQDLVFNPTTSSSRSGYSMSSRCPDTAMCPLSPKVQALMLNHAMGSGPSAA